MENSWFIRFTGSWLGVDISLALQENDPQLNWDPCHPTGTQLPWRLRSSLHTSSHIFTLFPSSSIPVTEFHWVCSVAGSAHHLSTFSAMPERGGETMEVGGPARFRYPCSKCILRLCARNEKCGMENDGKTHTFQSAPQECQSLEIGSMWHKQRQGHLLQPRGLFLSSRTAPLAEVKVRTLKYFKHLTPDPG